MSGQYSSIGVSLEVKKQFDISLMEFSLKQKSKVSPSEYILTLIGKTKK